MSRVPHEDEKGTFIVLEVTVRCDRVHKHVESDA